MPSHDMGRLQILGLLFFLFSSSSSLPFASSLCPPDQRNALLQFKDSVGSRESHKRLCDTVPRFDVYYRSSDSDPVVDRWDENTDCCSWDGVTCDDVTGDVTGLNLQVSGLRGALHSNISLLLPKLQVLGLSSCNLTELPHWLNSFENLTSLDLSSNRISYGALHSLNSFKKLTSLDLSSNRISDGALHSNISLRLPKLEVLELSSCNLTELPHWLNSFKKLTSLALSSNGISGEVPSWFWGIAHGTLEYLDLSNNLLEGGIQQLHWKRLSSINLQNNYFTGEVPFSICQLSSLATVDMSFNNLYGNMPPCLGNITNLESLELRSNNITGEIPSSICQLSSLYFLSLSSNDLSVFMPPCLGNTTNLESLYLASNNFTGEIPSSICQLSSLMFLDLSSNNLFGFMPPCLGNITNLIHLDLSSNKLQGPLSRSLVKHPNLNSLLLSGNEFSDLFPHWLEAPQLWELDLQSNKFHGNLTAFGPSLPDLRILRIADNNFTGWLPTEVFSNASLVIIDLSNNKFGGPVPLPSPITSFYSIARNEMTGKIPPLICNAIALEIIDLSNNDLTGNLPRCLTNFGIYLSILNLRGNHLEGTIPQSFSLGNILMTLDLSHNQIKGTLPRSLVKCKHLEVLDLGDNQIEDVFPRWLGTIQELKVLILRSNNFKGVLNISSGAKLFPKLHILDISNNFFGGSLPANLMMGLKSMMNGENGQGKELYMTCSSRSFSCGYSITVAIKGNRIELVKILTIFTTIDLSYNSFHGDIPEVFGRLHSLIGLNLAHNRLTGSIPPTLGNLTDLEWLDLSSNMLSGGIPSVLGDLASLGYLNLSKNQLMGRIPQDKHLSTFPSDSFSGNPNLCGTPLPKACLGDAQPPPPSSSSTFDYKGQDSWFHQKEVWIGYASGIVIGISIAYIAFETGRPKWLARGVKMLERRAAEWMEMPKQKKAIKFHG